MALQANERVRYTRARDTSLAVREHSPTTPRPPKLLDRVREANRLRHGSRSTEKSYVGWIRRYIVFHGKRHPAEMGAPEVTRFLSSLAVQGKVAASTQNQALSALLFLYRHFDRHVEFFSKRGVFHAPGRIRSIVTVRVDQARPLISPGYDHVPDEATARAHWLKYYVGEAGAV